MKVRDIKEIIKALPDDLDIWVNDDCTPDEIAIDFDNRHLTFIVRKLMGEN